MILNVVVNIKQIIKKGKKYNWTRPDKCRKCGHNRLWGHGYVQRYCESHSTLIWVKRYRCPCCSTVYTMRPKGVWRRFLTDIKMIAKSIKNKINHGVWLKEFSRQRQQYWFRGFKKQCIRVGYLLQEFCFKIFKKLMESAEIPVTHSIRFFKVYSA